MKFSKILLGIMLLILATSLVSAQEITSIDFTADEGLWVLMGGLIAGFIVLAVIIGLAVYVYAALALMTIAKKTNTKLSWLAWIPIANVYLITQIAGLNGLWTLALLLYFIPFIGGLAFLGISAWWWWRISETRKFPGWLGILMIIPLVNLVIMGVLAWTENK